MRVVFDVHVYVLNLLGGDSAWPEIVPLPPTSANAAADCVSLAFDANDFQLFLSEHILANTARVLLETGHSNELVEGYLAALLEIVEMSGGAVVQPDARDRGVADHEDNYILDLVVAADADILVSDDADLTSLSPWNGRVILRPYEFVNRVLQSRRHRR